MFRKLLLLSASLLAAAACMPLSARSLVEIDVIDRDSGQWLPEYAHRGRTYVPGVPGHRYGVRLTNTTAERVLVVLSVDGVNAVSGKTAHPSQTGYVLAPWQSTEIAGWRKSLDDVAQFYFTDLPDSYAARTGRPDNVGVIGIAVFRERQQYIPYPQPGPPIARGDAQSNRTEGKAAAPAASAAREASAAADSAYGEAAQQRIGTGHGAREWAPVGQTDFVRASRSPVQVTQLRYDDLDALAALGVLPRPQPYWGRDEPRAFPGSFVADPPAW
ncbi:MAG: hypothetical protein LH470_09000 [Lysobacter sp.]|nr:hypothetical protein [Lysobacter sp.]